LADSNDTSNMPAYSFIQDSNTGMFHITNDTLGFATGGVERVRIDTNGKVLIGTSNNTNSINLDMNGTIRTGAPTGDIPFIIARGGGADTANHISSFMRQNNGLSIRSYDRICLLPGVGSSTTNIGSGYVGINTSNPLYNLDITGTLRVTGNSHINGATNQLMLLDNSSYYFIGGGCNNLLQNAASIQIAGRSKAISGGSLSLTCTDNSYTNFLQVDSGGVFTETMRLTGGKLGIMTANPAQALDVVGNIDASSNILSAANTVGQTLLLQWGYQDFTYNQNYSLGLEPGNPNIAINGSFFNGGFLNGTDSSGECAWNKGRLIIRGCRVGTNYTPNTTGMEVRAYSSNNSNAVGWNTLASFNVSDQGSYRGYTTNISPWFSLGSNTGMTTLGLRVTTSNVTYRCGATYIHLAN